MSLLCLKFLNGGKKKFHFFYNSLKCCLRQCPLQPLLMHGCGHTDLVPIFSNVIKTSFRRAFVHGTSLSGMFFPHVADLAVASSMCFAAFPKWAVVLGGRGGGALLGLSHRAQPVLAVNRPVALIMPQRTVQERSSSCKTQDSRPTLAERCLLPHLGCEQRGAGPSLCSWTLATSQRSKQTHERGQSRERQGETEPQPRPARS